MAKNDYKNVEKVKELLGDGQLGGLRKRLSSTEKSLNDILKKLSALETQKSEREAAEAAAVAAAEAAALEREWSLRWTLTAIGYSFRTTMLCLTPTLLRD